MQNVQMSIAQKKISGGDGAARLGSAVEIRGANAAEGTNMVNRAGLLKSVNPRGGLAAPGAKNGRQGSVNANYYKQ